jgi:hypothetical protein
MKIIIKYKRHSRIVEYSSDDKLHEEMDKFARDLASYRGLLENYAMTKIRPQMTAEEFVPTYRLYGGKTAKRADDIVTESFQEIF